MIPLIYSIARTVLHNVTFLQLTHSQDLPLVSEKRKEKKCHLGFI